MCKQGSLFSTLCNEMLEENIDFSEVILQKENPDFILFTGGKIKIRRLRKMKVNMEEL